MARIADADIQPDVGSDLFGAGKALVRMEGGNGGIGDARGENQLVTLFALVGIIKDTTTNRQ